MIDQSLDDRGVVRLTLNRPDKRNALDDVMVDALIEHLTVVATDDRARAVLLDAAGEHFCAGADLVARNAPGGEKPRVGSIQRRVPTQSGRLIAQMMSVQVPIVCKVQGWAAGIGMQLVLASDFALAADDARFWEPFVRRGFTPDSGSTWLLPRRVGEARAREMLMLDRVLTGIEAAQWGVVHGAVPASELDAAVEDVLAKIVNGPTVALGLTKWLLHEGAQATLGQQLANEAFALELSSRSDDFREGMAAMREKRDPTFGGR
ncbi:MAG TPA: enoyl-CoA hydratase-related protein [Acidimicrobiia bacterium]|jgi:2-(1,2-epoxy-1,2-dihydrophenyl)acetyl-CoA isomerase|nr:enoyl-CoA hydratase-related protein [Acidimicrobiia bacterium]